MPTRPLPFHSLIKSLALCGCVLVGGCDPRKDPPTQLEVDIKMAGEIKDKDALAATFAQYLQIQGLGEKPFRVVLNEKTKTYSLRLVGKEAIPKTLLDQVAKGLAAVEKERTWPATLSVKASTDLDAFMKTTQREFPLVLGWKDAKVEAYVMSSPTAAHDALMQLQNKERKPTPVLCMLSFTPDPALPRLQGTYKEVYGDAAMGQTLRGGSGEMPFRARHRITFEQSVLAEAFDEPVARDGKIMFGFAIIPDAHIVELGSGARPIDMQGDTQKKCAGKLQQESPAASALIARAGMLSEVQAIGPVRLAPLSAAGK